MRSSNDRFEGRSFKKASVDQLLKEELHVCDLSFLQRFDKEIKNWCVNEPAAIYICFTLQFHLDADGVEKMKLSSGNREKNILQPGWEVFTVPAQMGSF